MARENEQKPSRWAGIKGYVIDVKNWFARDRVPLAAAAVAFYLTLSMVPLLLLAVSVASFFVSPAQAQAMVTGLTGGLGAGIGGALRDNVLTVVQHRGLLTGISLLVGLWSGSQVFVFVQSALNQIWNVQENRSFFVLRGQALLMVLVIGVLLLLAVGLNALMNTLGHTSLPLLSRILGGIPWIIDALIAILIPFIIVTLVFLIIYRYMSARNVSWATALPGAVVAGVLWVITLQLLSWYAANFANYSVLYGSLGGLVLIMLWFNYSAQILLFGAEVSTAHHNRRVDAGKEQERWWEVPGEQKK